MSDRGSGGLIRSLKRLGRRVKRLGKEVSRTELRFDSISRDFDEVLRKYGQPGPMEGDSHGGSGSGRRRGRILARATSPGKGDIGLLTMARGRRGSSRILIDDGKPIRLTRSLSELMLILAADGSEGNETLVGWKPKHQVVMQLEKRLERQFAPHALDNLVHRLRDRLDAGGVNPGFLQTDRRQGLRLALRRGGLYVTHEA